MQLIKSLPRLCLRQIFTDSGGSCNTGIRIYSPLTHSKTPLVLRSGDRSAFWYTCGPTVYDSAHIGHASSYVKIDILQRILREHFGIRLVTAMNITDIDDKIIVRSESTKRPWKVIATEYENEFWSDMARLGVRPPDIKIRVTEKMDLIIRFIDKIVQKDAAYEKNGSVYFRVKAFPAYGKLVKFSPEEEEEDANGKQHAADFALWKAAKSEAEPSWDSPWGRGRPGWHIECSALASHLFGDRIDFHAGGIDLKFPHHENEEAQSCTFHDQDQWVDYWIHTGHLTLKDVKMSKSLRNTISISELLSRFSADEFRMACLLSHYRTPMEFTVEGMNPAKAVLGKFRTFLGDCEAYVRGARAVVDVSPSKLCQARLACEEHVQELLRDDFNTAKSIERLLELATIVNKELRVSETNAFQFSSSPAIIQDVYNYILAQLRTFGLLEGGELAPSTADTKVDDLVNDIVHLRNRVRLKAKAEKNRELFAVCDDLRNILIEKGVEIKDQERDSVWSYKKQ